MKKLIFTLVVLVLILVSVGVATVIYYDDSTIDIQPKITEEKIDSIIHSCESDSIIDATKLTYQRLMLRDDLKLKDVDKIIIQNIYNPIDILFPKKLNLSEINLFVALLNDSTNFTWGETTFDEVDYKIQLFKDGKKVSILWVGSDCNMIDCYPINPRMKYGMLSVKGLKEIHNFIN